MYSLASNFVRRAATGRPSFVGPYCGNCSVELLLADYLPDPSGLTIPHHACACHARNKVRNCPLATGGRRRSRGPERRWPWNGAEIPWRRRAFNEEPSTSGAVRYGNDRGGRRLQGRTRRRTRGALAATHSPKKLGPRAHPRVKSSGRVLVLAFWAARGRCVEVRRPIPRGRSSPASWTKDHDTRPLIRSIATPRRHRRARPHSSPRAAARLSASPWSTPGRSHHRCSQSGS